MVAYLDPGPGPRFLKMEFPFKSLKRTEQLSTGSLSLQVRGGAKVAH